MDKCGIPLLFMMCSRIFLSYRFPFLPSPLHANPCASSFLSLRSMNAWHSRVSSRPSSRPPSQSYFFAVATCSHESRISSPSYERRSSAHKAEWEGPLILAAVCTRWSDLKRQPLSCPSGNTRWPRSSFFICCRSSPFSRFLSVLTVTFRVHVTASCLAASNFPHNFLLC